MDYLKKEEQGLSGNRGQGLLSLSDAFGEINEGLYGYIYKKLFIKKL